MPYDTGWNEAVVDINNHIYVFRTYGLTGAPNFYRNLLYNKYHIRLEDVAGCVVNEPIETWVQGYNEAMLSYLKEKFGAQILDDAEHEAAIEETKYWSFYKETGHLDTNFSQYANIKTKDDSSIYIWRNNFRKLKFSKE